MWALLGDRYPIFKSWISALSDRVMPDDVSHFVFPRQRKLPYRLKNIIVSSIHDSHWGKVSGYLSEYTPRAFFMIDVISEHGFVPGVFDVGQSFGLLIEKFKCYWKHFLRPAFPTLEDDYNAAKHCTCFGLSTLSAFPLHLKLRHPKALWSILIQASLYCNKESTGFRNCRSHWVPDWNQVWYPAICSAIKCMSLRVRYCHRLRDACLQGIQEREKQVMSLFLKLGRYFGVTSATSFEIVQILSDIIYGSLFLWHHLTWYRALCLTFQLICVQTYLFDKHVFVLLILLLLLLSLILSLLLYMV